MRASSVESCFNGCIVMVIVLVVLAFVVGGLANFTHRGTVAGTVQSTYLKHHGNHDHFYVVIKDDDGVIHIVRNADSFWFGRWSSADDQARFLPGAKVQLRTYGYRIQIFSLFPNIYRVEYVK